MRLSPPSTWPQWICRACIAIIAIAFCPLPSPRHFRSALIPLELPWLIAVILIVAVLVAFDIFVFGDSAQFAPPADDGRAVTLGLNERELDDQLGAREGKSRLMMQLSGPPTSHSLNGFARNVFRRLSSVEVGVRAFQT